MIPSFQINRWIRWRIMLRWRRRMRWAVSQILTFKFKVKLSHSHIWIINISHMYFHFYSPKSCDFIINFLSTKLHAIIDSDRKFQSLSFVRSKTFCGHSFGPRFLSCQTNQTNQWWVSGADSPMDGDPDISIHLLHTPSPRQNRANTQTKESWEWLLVLWSCEQPLESC